MTYFAPSTLTSWSFPEQVPHARMRALSREVQVTHRTPNESWARTPPCPYRRPSGHCLVSSKLRATLSQWQPRRPGSSWRSSTKGPMMPRRRHSKLATQFVPLSVVPHFGSRPRSHIGRSQLGIRPQPLPQTSRMPGRRAVLQQSHGGSDPMAFFPFDRIKTVLGFVFIWKPAGLIGCVLTATGRRAWAAWERVPRSEPPFLLGVVVWGPRSHAPLRTPRRGVFCMKLAGEPPEGLKSLLRPSHSAFFTLRGPPQPW